MGFLPPRARPWLAGAVVIGCGQAVLLVAQAAVLARPARRRVLRRHFPAPRRARARAADRVLRRRPGPWPAGPGRACTESCRPPGHGGRPAPGLGRRPESRAPRTPPQPRRSPRRRSPPWPAPARGGMTTLIGSGVDELDSLVARVLPQDRHGRGCFRLCCWPGLRAWIRSRLRWPPRSCSSQPALAGLVGADTSAAVRRRLASLDRLSARFDALVEGLPLLRAFGRAVDHERSVAASGEEVRMATLAVLKVALAAGLVLELLAAVGTALGRGAARPESGRRPADPPAGPWPC